MKSEAELSKIEIFANYCEGQYNFAISSSIATYIALMIAFLQFLYEYQGNKSLFLSSNGIFLIIYGAVVSLILFYGYLFVPTTRNHDEDMDHIQLLLEKVDKQESVPTLAELRKQRKEWNKRKKRVGMKAKSAFLSHWK